MVDSDINSDYKASSFDKLYIRRRKWDTGCFVRAHQPKYWNALTVGRGHADDGCSCNHRAVPPSDHTFSFGYLTITCMCVYIYICVCVWVCMYIYYICISKYVMAASNICYLFPFNPGSTLNMTCSSPGSDLQIRRGAGDGLIPWTVRVGSQTWV